MSLKFDFTWRIVKKWQMFKCCSLENVFIVLPNADDREI